MSVRDDRRQPFTWLANDALARVRVSLPAVRQPGARNALLSLAEAASRQHDGQHTSSHTLREVAGLAGLSERRLRDHLTDLQAIGLVEIIAPRDYAGRDLPKIYILRDGPDKSSDRSDDLADAPRDESSGPTRARVTTEEEEARTPPIPPQAGGDDLPRLSPPNGNRKRDRAQHAQLVTEYAERLFPDGPLESARQCVEQAIKSGHGTPAGIRAHAAHWFSEKLTDGSNGHPAEDTA